MFLVVLLMFSLSMLNLALGLVRILQGIVYNARSSGSALATQQLGQSWVNLVKPLSVHIQTMIADVVLITQSDYTSHFLMNSRGRLHNCSHVHSRPVNIDL